MSVRLRESAADAVVVCTVRKRPEAWWSLDDVVVSSGLDVRAVESALEELAGLGLLERRRVGEGPVRWRENWVYRLTEWPASVTYPPVPAAAEVRPELWDRVRGARARAGWKTVRPYSLRCFSQVVRVLVRAEPIAEELSVAELVKRAQVNESAVRWICADLVAVGHASVRVAGEWDSRVRRGTGLYRMSGLGREVYTSSAPGEWEAEVIGRGESGALG